VKDGELRIENLELRVKSEGWGVENVEFRI
jgi:hypothetical protein